MFLINLFSDKYRFSMELQLQKISTCRIDIGSKWLQRACVRVSAVCLLGFSAVTKVSRATVSKYSEVSLVCSPAPSRVLLSEVQPQRVCAEVHRTECSPAVSLPQQHQTLLYYFFHFERHLAEVGRQSQSGHQASSY